MKVLYTFLSFLFASLLVTQQTEAQEGWPKSVTGSNGATVKMYQWEPESFTNNVLVARAAVSVTESGKSDPTFGVAWIKANAETVNQQVNLKSVQITDLKLPGENTDDQAADVRATLEKAIPQWNLSFTTNDLNEALAANQQADKLSTQISTTPPKVIYTTKPSILVMIDGTPRLQHNDELGVDVVVNTPFTIIKNNDGRYYLNGGSFWYIAPDATGPYSYVSNPPSTLQKIEQAMKQQQDASKQDAAAKGDDAANNDNNSGTTTGPQDNTIYNIVVSTEPQELIQSKGEASFSPIQGTNLLYVSNSDNDIFMDVNSQQYYVLISGRWYKSKTLNGDWQYISSDKLPQDFAKIPEGSAKDNVLASVAGTEAAKEAVMQAQIPQTAKVDRKTATAKVDYDGDPQFENIDGTEMAYATNTPTSVIRWRGRYYAVDDGVWFEASAPEGPWTVAVERPYVVDYIPPRYPVYNMKYVYIYDVMPDYVYMGYTPGYLNTYIYGPTIVYGTGWYYRPWYGNYYYPRPHTWGFYMRYNPWIGWGFGLDVSYGWFNWGWYDNYYYGSRGWGGFYHGGWWGPSAYRPPYCAAPYRSGRGYYGSYYGRSNGRMYNRNVTIVNRTNIYNYRRDVVTRTNSRLVDNRANRPGGFANNERNERRPGYNNSNGSAGTRPTRTINSRPENSNGNNPFGRPNRAITNGAGDNSNRPNREINNRPGNNPINRPGREINNNGDARPGNNPFGNRPRTTPNTGDNNANRPSRPSFERPGSSSPTNGRVISPRESSSAPQQRNLQDWRENGRSDNSRPRPTITNPESQPSSRPQRADNGWSRPQPQSGGEVSRPSRSFESRPSPSGESRPSFGGGSRPQMSGGGESRPSYGGGGSRPQSSGGSGSSGHIGGGSGRPSRRG